MVKFALRSSLLGKLEHLVEPARERKSSELNAEASTNTSTKPLSLHKGHAD